jgi:alanine racemase
MNICSTNRPTWAEIDLDNLAFNYGSVGTFVGKNVSLMAVVKSNAYGHGAIPCATRLQNEGAEWFAVATLEEAIELRQNGIQRSILIFGGMWPGQERDLLNFNLTPAIFTIDQAVGLDAEAAKQNKKVHVHVKIDTGMNRVGFQRAQWRTASSTLASLSNIEVQGIMTHFAVAEKLAETEFTERQMELFAEAVKIFLDAGHRPEYVDMANSPAAIIHPLSRSKMVRIGGLLYGLGGDIINEALDKPELRPVMSLYTRIAMLKTVLKGESIGYGRTYIAGRDRLIATIPVGYNDGYPRNLSNTASVIVNGTIAQVVGRISMDWTTVDVTDCPKVNVGDLVTLIGNDGDNSVTAKDLAQLAGTLSYEITCGIGQRVPRINKQN